MAHPTNNHTMERLVRTALLGLFIISASFLQAGEGHRFTFGGGVFDSLGQPQSNALIVAFSPGIVIHGFRPLFAVVGGEKGDRGTFTGVLYDWNYRKGWHLLPAFCLGYYHYDHGYDLGGSLEFKSSVTWEHVLGERTRVGLSWQHISNGDLYERNPGINLYLATFTWILPVH